MVCWSMIFNTICNNISAISWGSALLVGISWGVSFIGGESNRKILTETEPYVRLGDQRLHGGDCKAS